MMASGMVRDGHDGRVASARVSAELGEFHWWRRLRCVRSGDCPVALWSGAVGEIHDQLGPHLRGKPAPFLFVGSGLTRRYTGSEDWEGLLRVFAEQTARPYEYFRASAGGDLPAVASAIAEEFHDTWWVDERYADAREEWSARLTDRSSAFKVEVSRHVGAAVDRLPTTGLLAAEIELLEQATVDGIITTNFDPVLEALFPDLRVFVGQDQMLFSNPQSVGEIYKIHGSCEDPDSLVITAEDYQRFEDRNAYLAAKLLTTFVEHPVIFLGYSLSDRNVQSVLRSIARCLTQANVDELRDRLIFVQWSPDGVESASPHTIMVDDFVITVVRVVVHDFVDTFELLAGLPRVFPARLLRRLKEHVYELVLHDDPAERLAVVDIDEVGNEDIDVVFGVGLKQRLNHVGYRGLERWQLIDDVVEQGDEFDANAIIDEALPQILRVPGNVPTYKYLRQAGKLTKAGTIRKNTSIDPRIERMAEKHRNGDPAGKQYEQAAGQHLAGVVGIADLEERAGAAEVFNYGTCMPAAKVDTDELRDFLRRNRDSLEGNWLLTQYAKLACYLDWLEFGRPQ